MAWPYVALTFIYCSTIVWLSGQSNPPMPANFFPHWDKVEHIGAWGLLDALVLLGMLRAKKSYSLRALLWFPPLFAIAFGIADEFHQHFVPGRMVDPLDIVADSTGAMLTQGAFLLSVYRPGLRRFWPAELPAPIAPREE